MTLMAVVFSETALSSASFGTSFGISDCRAGWLKAIDVPEMNAVTNTCHGAMRPEMISTAMSCVHRERHALRGEEDAFAVEAVGGDAGDQPEDEHRDHARRDDEAHHERGVGELQDEDGARDLLHPEPTGVAGLPEPEQAVVAVAQRGEGADAGFGTQRSATGKAVDSSAGCSNAKATPRSRTGAYRCKAGAALLSRSR